MIILAHHRVNPAPRGPLSVTTSDFRSQLLYLLERGYRNVSLEDIANGLEKARLLERTFALTFDDGYRDNYLHAMPILEELRLKATVFVTVNCVDTDHLYPWDAERAVVEWGGPREEDLSVTWDQIHHMERSGIFRIGSHTLSHPRLATVDGNLARQEISASKHVLEERLGRPVRLFCYPYGNLNREVVSMVRDAGYTLGVVTPPRPVPRSQYTLPRIGIYKGTDFGHFKRKASPLYQTLLWAGMLPYVQVVRRRLARAQQAG
jgi:peptidoglycan/xylan/chitin deacetylase (PgdA/CDA1 family)